MADIGANLGNDPTGGIVQANTDKIARQLLGDDLVNQYGDVMGARAPTWRDRVRDFTAGFTGGPDKANSLKAQARTAYDNARYKAAQAGLVQARAARAKGVALADSIRAARDAPPSQRKALFSAMLEEQGLDHSPAVAGLFMHDDVVGSRAMDTFDKGLRDGSITVDEAAVTLGSTKMALDYLGKLRTEDRQATKVAAEVHRDNVSSARQQQRLDEARTKNAPTSYDARRAAYIDKSFGRVKVPGEGRLAKPRAATAEELGATFDAAHSFEKPAASTFLGGAVETGLGSTPVPQEAPVLGMKPKAAPVTDPVAASKSLLGL